MDTTVDKPLVDWVQIKEACEKGLSYSQAADRFGVKKDTIAKRSQREGWRGSVRLAASSMAGSIMKDTSIHRRTAEQIANKASDSVAGMVVEFMSTAFQKSKQIMDRAHDVAMAADTATDLKNATIAFGIAHQHGRLAAGLDRPDGGIKSPWAAMQQAAVQAGPVIDVEQVSESKPLATAVHPSE